MIPRIQGKIGTVEDPPEFAGQFCFQLFLSTMGGGEPESLGQWGPFKTEPEAKRAMMEMTRVACEAIEKSVDGKTSGKYIDMKDNTIKKWDMH